METDAIAIKTTVFLVLLINHQKETLRKYHRRRIVARTCETCFQGPGAHKNTLGMLSFHFVKIDFRKIFDSQKIFWIWDFRKLPSRFWDQILTSCIFMFLKIECPSPSITSVWVALKCQHAHNPG